MQIDALTAAAISVASTLFGVGLAWGLMTQKVNGLVQKMNSLEQDLKDFREDLDKKSESFVTHPHFSAVTGPLHQSINIIQKDIKEILKLIRS